MFRKLKKRWRSLSRGQPGRRFQDRYERREGARSGLWKAFYVVAGVALCLAGVVLMPAPGPGFLVVFIGGAMLAEESLVAARVLDWIELRLRALHSRLRRAWRRASTALKALVALCGAAIASLLGFTAYALFVQ
ncbi:MAG TPA: PGPGW domain-containing protein [Burkholderiales bacterium]|nr:PGPGW domain-containing protein [Burkholderiales bacterium]